MKNIIPQKMTVQRAPLYIVILALLIWPMSVLADRSTAGDINKFDINEVPTISNMNERIKKEISGKKEFIKEGDCFKAEEEGNSYEVCFDNGILTRFKEVKGLMIQSEITNWEIIRNS